MNRQRIAVVTTSYPEHAGDPSGHFVQAEARALEREGHDVQVFALRGRAFGWPGVASRLRENPLGVFSAAREVARTTRTISRSSLFSRVIAHWAIPSAWPIANSCTNVEVVSHGGDVRLLTSLPPALRERLVGRIMQNASIWRFPSETLEGDFLSSLAPQLAARVASIARVVAPTLDATVPREHVDRAHAAQSMLSRGAQVLAVAARLVPSKRVDRAIVYAAANDATLIVIGDGPEKARLQRLARELHANAHFLGLLSRPETLAHIAAADALVHMSEQEGLSSVVREADALGTRVITRP